MAFYLQARTRGRPDFLYSASKGQEFVLRDSTIRFDSVLMTVSNPFVKIIGNDFSGNGSIVVDSVERSNMNLTLVEEAEVFAPLALRRAALSSFSTTT